MRRAAGLGRLLGLGVKEGAQAPRNANGFLTTPHQKQVPRVRLLLGLGFSVEGIGLLSGFRAKGCLFSGLG